MTAKKKLWTVLATFALVVVVAAASVGITYAALQGSVTSKFTISYTASNVEASLSAKYANDSGKTTFTDLTTQDSESSEDNKTIKFTTATSDQTTKTFEDVSASFATPKDYILIIFTFTNDSTSHDLEVVANYQGSGADNVTIASKWQDNNTGEPSAYDAWSGAMAKQTITKKSEAATSSYLYVKIGIEDVTKDVSGFVANFSFTLTNAAA